MFIDNFDFDDDYGMDDDYGDWLRVGPITPGLDT